MPESTTAPQFLNAPRLSNGQMQVPGPIILSSGCQIRKKGGTTATLQPGEYTELPVDWVQQVIEKKCLAIQQQAPGHPPPGPVVIPEATPAAEPLTSTDTEE